MHFVRGFYLVTAVKDFREITPEGELRLNFHRGQTQAWLADDPWKTSGVRIVAVQCGARWGKTSLGPHWLEREMERMGPGDYLAVTANYPLLESAMLPELHEVFVTLYRRFSYKASTRIFESHKQLRGRPAYRILVRSAHAPEGLESARIKAAWCDEVGQHEFTRQAWEAINRRVSIDQGRFLLTTTIYEIGWYKYEIYDRREGGDKSIVIIQGDSIDNPIFPLEEYERQKAILPLWRFNMAYRGIFSYPSGLIYDSFNSDICLIPRFNLPQEWPRYVGHDFGPNNTAAIWYASDPITGYLYAYREYHAGGLSNHDHAQRWKSLSGDESIRNRVGGARAETGFREACTAAGWPVAEPREFGVDAGINIVYGWHQQNKLFVFNDLDMYIAEKTSYTRELDSDYTPTEKIANKSKFHLMDAERYILSHMGPERTLSSETIKVNYHNGKQETRRGRRLARYGHR